MNGNVDTLTESVPCKYEALAQCWTCWADVGPTSSLSQPLVFAVILCEL